MDHLPSVLQNEYMLRRSRNSAYSKRAFAKSLNISSGALIELMEGRRKASPKLVQRLFDKIGYLTQPQEMLEKRDVLPLEKFEMISQIVHFHILNLLKTKKHPGTTQEIAKRLSISETTATESLNRLKKLGLVEKNRSGKWVRLATNIETPEHILSRAIQRAHREALQKAEVALDLPPEERDFTLVVMSASADQMPLIRKKIRAFQDELDELCAQGSCEEVYQINVQFFPVSDRGVKL